MARAGEEIKPQKLKSTVKNGCPNENPLPGILRPHLAQEKANGNEPFSAACWPAGPLPGDLGLYLLPCGLGALSYLGLTGFAGNGFRGWGRLVTVCEDAGADRFSVRIALQR